MHSRSTTCALFGLLLCLGPLAAAAQDNPWRVPSIPAQGPTQVQTWQDQVPSTNAPPAIPQNGYGGQSPYQSGSYAALPPEQARPNGRTMTDGGFDYGYRSGAPLPQPSASHSADGSGESDAVAPDRVAARQQHTYGAFPPLDGLPPPTKSQAPQAEGRLLPLPGEGTQAPPAPGYGYGYGGYRNDSYGSAYRYDPYNQYRDPMWSGPSTFAGPWDSNGGGVYGGPYGFGSPPPYGW